MNYSGGIIRVLYTACCSIRCSCACKSEKRIPQARESLVQFVTSPQSLRGTPGIRRERTLGRGERHDDVNLGPPGGCGGYGNQRQDASSGRPSRLPTKHVDKEMIDG